MRIYNALVLNIRTYGAEIWALNKQNKNKMRAKELEEWKNWKLQINKIRSYWKRRDKNKNVTGTRHSIGM